MKKTTEVNTNSFSTINSNTRIKGEVFSETDIRIDGRIEGNIDCKAKVVLGTSAYVKGNIVCQNADISCTMSGNIYVEGLLKLNSTSKLTGDIFTQKLVVESGAIFIGKCEMGQNKSIKDMVNSNQVKTLTEIIGEETKQSS